MEELQKSLTNLAKFWSKVLGLADWRIKVEIIDRKDCKKEKDHAMVNGIVFPELHERTATVCVINPEDYEPGDSGFAYDPEKILLHEILHIPLEYFSGRDFDCEDYYDPKNIMREQFINQMASVLVGLTQDKKEVVADA